MQLYQNAIDRLESDLQKLEKIHANTQKLLSILTSNAHVINENRLKTLEDIRQNRH